MSWSKAVPTGVHKSCKGTIDLSRNQGTRREEGATVGKGPTGVTRGTFPALAGVMGGAKGTPLKFGEDSRDFCQGAEKKKRHLLERGRIKRLGRLKSKRGVGPPRPLGVRLVNNHPNFRSQGTPTWDRLGADGPFPHPPVVRDVARSSSADASPHPIPPPTPGFGDSRRGWSPPRFLLRTSSSEPRTRLS